MTAARTRPGPGHVLGLVSCGRTQTKQHNTLNVFTTAAALLWSLDSFVSGHSKPTSKIQQTTLSLVNCQGMET